MMKDQPVYEIMNRKVVSIRVDDPFSLVEDKMRSYHIRHLPVVEDDDVLVGIITMWDFNKAYRPRKTDEGEVYDDEEMDRLILKHQMTPKPTTLKLADTIEKAVKILMNDQFSTLPVVDEDGKLVGIVTLIDILKLVAKHMF